MRRSRVRRSSTVTPVTRPSVVLDAAHEREVAKLEALRERVPRLDQRAEHDVGARPAHRAVGLRVPRDRAGCSGRSPSGSSAPNSSSSSDRMAAPTAESANAASCTCSSRAASVDELVPLVVGDEGDPLAERRAGVAQVQCAPMPPTFVDAAAAGKVGACADPSPPKSSRCVPPRAVNMPSTTADDGMPSDSRKRAGLRPLRAARGPAPSPRGRGCSARSRRLSRSVAGRPRT